MLKQLPLKKEYLLGIAIIVLLLLSYQLAFKKTVELWQLNSRLKKQLQQSTDVSYQPGYLERKNSNLDKAINLYKADTVDFRSNIISNISSLAIKENVKLTAVPPQDPFYHTDKFVIEKLEFEGGFFSLAKVLNSIQSAKGIGMPRAATFRSVAIRLNNEETKKMILEVYLEVVK